MFFVFLKILFHNIYRSMQVLYPLSYITLFSYSFTIYRLTISLTPQLPEQDNSHVAFPHNIPN